MKVHAIPHAIFEITRSGFIQIWHRHERKLLCISLAQTLYTLDKKSPLKCNFQTFEWLGENSPNSLSFLKPQASFFLNLTSLFSVMRDNSSLLF